MTAFKKIVLILFLGMAVASTWACPDSNDGPAEHMGEKMDDAAEHMGDKMEDLGDKAKDATDSADN